MSGFCEHGNVRLNSVKILYHVSDCQLLKNYAPRNLYPYLYHELLLCNLIGSFE